jgi:hypothetical protein
MYEWRRDSEIHFVNNYDQRNESRELQTIENSIPQNIVKSDGWSFQIAFALLPLIFVTPFFKIIGVQFESKFIAKLIKFIQKVLVLCTLILLIFLIIYLYNIMINPLEIERNRWVSISYILMSVYFIIFLMTLWLRNHDLEDLICGYKYPADVASNIEFYPLIKYFVKNILGIKEDISNKDRINRLFKFSFQILNLLIYLLFYSFYIFYLMERPGASEYITLRLVIALPLYIFFIETELIHTTICWMIFSRFKHLNRTIKHFNKDIVLNSYKLKLIIEWFSQNIEQMKKFNRIFSLVMSLYFFSEASRLLIAIEDLIFDYGKVQINISVCDLFFNIHKILVILYITKQINDISKEASKTSRLVNELCLSKFIDEKVEQMEKLRIKVNIPFLNQYKFVDRCHLMRFKFFSMIWFADQAIYQPK